LRHRLTNFKKLVHSLETVRPTAVHCWIKCSKCPQEYVCWGWYQNQ